MAKNEAQGAREPRRDRQQHRPRPTPPKQKQESTDTAADAAAPSAAPPKLRETFRQVPDLCRKFDTHEEAAAYRDTLAVDPNKNKTRIRRRTGGDKVQFETLFFSR